MTTEKLEGFEAGTFRAHIWSPLNGRETILELRRGTTVEQLLIMLADVWGDKLRPDRGYLYRTGLVAGWCLLCRSEKGVCIPFGIEDQIPDRPVEDETGDRYNYEWFHTAIHRSQRRDMAPEATMEDSEAFLNPAMFRGYGWPIHVPGVMHTGPEGCPRDPHDLMVLASGPEPKELVDVRLVLIIACSGT